MAVTRLGVMMRGMDEHLTQTVLNIDPQVFWGFVSLGGFALACVIVFALLGAPKDGQADPLVQLKTNLGLKNFNSGLFLIGALIWSMIFGLLAFGLIWLIWDLIWIAAPNTGDNKEDIWNLRFDLVKLTALTATLGAVVALPITMQRLRLTRLQTTTAEEGLITDRISKAVEGLGAEKNVKSVHETPRYQVDDKGKWRKDDNGKPVPALRPDDIPIVDREVLERSEPNLEVRVGAIFALERIAQDSDRDHIQIMEILCSYVRSNSPAISSEKKPQPKPRTDIQSAMQVLGRRRPEKVRIERAARNSDIEAGYNLDLSNSCFDGLDMSELNFKSAIFRGCQFRNAYLRKTKLKNAVVEECDLSGADLRKTKFQGARIWNSKLHGANLRGAEFHAASLRRVDFPMDRLVGQSPDTVFWDTTLLNNSDFSSAFLRMAGQQNVNYLHLQRKFIQKMSIPEFRDSRTAYVAWRVWQKEIGYEAE